MVYLGVRSNVNNLDDDFVHCVACGGYFVRLTQLPLRKARDTFGEENGAPTWLRCGVAVRGLKRLATKTALVKKRGFHKPEASNPMRFRTIAALVFIGLLCLFT